MCVGERDCLRAAMCVPCSHVSHVLSVYAWVFVRVCKWLFLCLAAALTGNADVIELLRAHGADCLAERRILIDAQEPEHVSAYKVCSFNHPALVSRLPEPMSKGNACIKAFYGC
jgi:hypothetical protein